LRKNIREKIAGTTADRPQLKKLVAALDAVQGARAASEPSPLAIEQPMIRRRGRPPRRSPAT
jgi:hypothetical protein